MKYADMIMENLLYVIGTIIFIISITLEYPYTFYYGSTAILAFGCGKALKLMIRHSQK